jgi:hypothetical protein
MVCIGDGVASLIPCLTIFLFVKFFFRFCSLGILTVLDSLSGSRSTYLYFFPELITGSSSQVGVGNLRYTPARAGLVLQQLLNSPIIRLRPSDASLTHKPSQNSLLDHLEFRPTSTHCLLAQQIVYSASLSHFTILIPRSLHYVYAGAVSALCALRFSFCQFSFHPTLTYSFPYTTPSATVTQ